MVSPAVVAEHPPGVWVLQIKSLLWRTHKAVLLSTVFSYFFRLNHIPPDHNTIRWHYFLKVSKYYLLNISLNEVQVSENKSFLKPIWDFFSFCSKFNPNAPRNAVLGKWRKPPEVSTPAAMNVWTALKTTTVTRRVITVTATWAVTCLDHFS